MTGAMLQPRGGGSPGEAAARTPSEAGVGADLTARTTPRAKMISEFNLQELPVDIPDVGRAAWSHWMALAATRQPFFDANHRTALRGFDLASTRALGFVCAGEGAELEAMMSGSRKLVQEAPRQSARAPRIASVFALRGSEQPALRFCASFKANLGKPGA
jgi:hypothetical protein